jgi:hypothetical protein
VDNQDRSEGAWAEDSSTLSWLLGRRTTWSHIISREHPQDAVAISAVRKTSPEERSAHPEATFISSNWPERFLCLTQITLPGTHGGSNIDELAMLKADDAIGNGDRLRTVRNHDARDVRAAIASPILDSFPTSS